MHSQPLFSSVTSAVTNGLAPDDWVCLSVEGDGTSELEELPSSEEAISEAPEVDGSVFFEASAAVRTVAVVSCKLSLQITCNVPLIQQLCK